MYIFYPVHPVPYYTDMMSSCKALQWTGVDAGDVYASSKNLIFLCREKERLRRPGPKFGTVVRIWAENCAFEVKSILQVIFHF